MLPYLYIASLFTQCFVEDVRMRVGNNNKNSSDDAEETREYIIRHFRDEIVLQFQCRIITYYKWKYFSASFEYERMWNVISYSWRKTRVHECGIEALFFCAA